MLTVINPGEEVLVPSPGFASYEAQVLMAGGRPVPYKLIEEKGFQPDIEELSRMVTGKTKAILLNSPSNPTGSVLSERTIKEIAELAVERSLIIISDEAYERILYDEAQHVSVASLPGMQDLTVSVFSLSKTYAMTGWRIGYAVSSREIISEMTKLQEHLAAHPSSISQVAAVAALTGPDDYVEMMVKEYAERRNLVVRELSRMPGLRCVKPMGAFYVFPNISEFGTSSRDFAMHLLKETKVVVVPGTAFGRFGEGHIRVSYSVSKENLLKALSKIGEALERVST
jgi:aspartate/methionine/tyrosine aminotransferase